MDKAPLSVCLIVKNEERYIAQSLGSVRDFATQIVVVDTGSTDRTKEIAQDLGAEIHNFNWCDDFSAARNFSIEKASQEWILVLDGDEVIATKDLPRLREVLQGQKVAYQMAKRHYTFNISSNGFIPNKFEYLSTEKGAGYFQSVNILLFPNDPRIRYRGAVHELVEESVAENNIPFSLLNIPIHHYGHLDEERRKERGALYEKLGQKKLKEEVAHPPRYSSWSPNSPSLPHFLLATFLGSSFRSGQYLQLLA